MTDEKTNVDSNREAIVTIEGTRSNFSERDQTRGDRVRRLQHVAAFPSDKTLTFSVMTNGTRNNPISRRYIDVRDEMMGKSKHDSQGKRIMR